MQRGDQNDAQTLLRSKVKRIKTSGYNINPLSGRASCFYVKNCISLMINKKIMTLHKTASETSSSIHFAIQILSPDYYYIARSV